MANVQTAALAPAPHFPLDATSASIPTTPKDETRNPPPYLVSDEANSDGVSTRAPSSPRTPPTRKRSIHLSDHAFDGYPSYRREKRVSPDRRKVYINPAPPYLPSPPGEIRPGDRGWRPPPPVWQDRKPPPPVPRDGIHFERLPPPSPNPTRTPSETGGLVDRPPPPPTRAPAPPAPPKHDEPHIVNFRRPASPSQLDDGNWRPVPPAIRARSPPPPPDNPFLQARRSTKPSLPQEETDRPGSPRSLPSSASTTDDGRIRPLPPASGDRPPPPPPLHSGEEMIGDKRGNRHSLGRPLIPDRHTSPDSLRDSNGYVGRADGSSTALQSSHSSISRDPDLVRLLELKADSRASSTLDRPRTPSNDDEEDIEYARQANAHFPPIYPTVNVNGPPAVYSKASIAKQISSRVARIEHMGRGGAPPAEREKELPSIQSLWQELKEKRENLYVTRTSMAKTRKGLRELRRRKDFVDNAFMSLVRPTLVKNRRGHPSASDNTSMLEKRFEEMQSLRNEYHFHEAAYEGFEVALDEQEDELARLETRFFSELAHERTNNPPEKKETQEEPEAQQSNAQASNLPVVLLGISPDGPPVDIHPLYRDLMDMIGDFNIAEEEWHDLLISKEQIEYSVEIKETVGKAPNAEEEEFLNEYRDEEQDKRNKVEAARAEVMRLKTLCEEKHAIPRHLPFKVLYPLYKAFADERVEIGEDMDLKDEWPPTGTLAHHRFPRLLSQPNYVLENPMPLLPEASLEKARKLASSDKTRLAKIQIAQGERNLETIFRRFKAGDKMDYVTRWLFQQLRLSPLNANLMWRIMNQHLKVLDSQTWEKDALLCWWRDEGAPPDPDLASTTSAHDSVSMIVGPQRHTPGPSRAGSEPPGQREVELFMDHNLTSQARSERGTDLFGEQRKQERLFEREVQLARWLETLVQ